eukprot:COSAG02_NODE_444_length_22204_cov_21.041167_6_plen_235_part_00
MDFSLVFICAQSVSEFLWDRLRASIQFPVMPKRAQYARFSGEAVYTVDLPSHLDSKVKPDGNSLDSLLTGAAGWRRSSSEVAHLVPDYQYSIFSFAQTLPRLHVRYRICIGIPTRLTKNRRRAVCADQLQKPHNFITNVQNKRGDQGASAWPWTFLSEFSVLGGAPHSGCLSLPGWGCGLLLDGAPCPSLPLPAHCRCPRCAADTTLPVAVRAGCKGGRALRLLLGRGRGDPAE